MQRTNLESALKYYDYHFVKNYLDNHNLNVALNDDGLEVKFHYDEEFKLEEEYPLNDDQKIAVIKTLLLGAYHEMYNDRDYESYYDAIIKLLENNKHLKCVVPEPEYVPGPGRNCVTLDINCRVILFVGKGLALLKEMTKDYDETELHNIIFYACNNRTFDFVINVATNLKVRPKTFDFVFSRLYELNKLDYVDKLLKIRPDQTEAASKAKATVEAEAMAKVAKAKAEAEAKAAVDAAEAAARRTYYGAGAGACGSGISGYRLGLLEMRQDKERGGRMDESTNVNEFTIALMRYKRGYG